MIKPAEVDRTNPPCIFSEDMYVKVLAGLCDHNRVMIQSSGQIIATSAEVTPKNDGLRREASQILLIQM